MNIVYVAGHWMQVTDLSFQELKDLLDAVASDLREQGATNFYVDGVDQEHGAIFLCGLRERTVEEVVRMERSVVERRDTAVSQHVNAIKLLTGKEVKIED